MRAFLDLKVLPYSGRTDRQPSGIHSFSRDSLEIFGLINTRSFSFSFFSNAFLPKSSKNILPETTNILNEYPICGAAIATPSLWLFRATDISFNTFFILVVLIIPEAYLISLYFETCFPCLALLPNYQALL